MLLLLLLLVSAYYIYEKRHLKLIPILAFSYLYTCTINLNYSTGALDYYLENQYLTLILFIGLPFAYDLFSDVRLRPNWGYLLAIIILARLARIVGVRQTYTNRLDWYRGIMDRAAQKADKKLVLKHGTWPKDTLLMSWGVSYECWLLSTIEHGESRSIIAGEVSNEFDWAMPENDVFIAKWGKFKYSELDSKYFVFRDSSKHIKY
jgi:hypothetical protein